MTDTPEHASVELPRSMYGGGNFGSRVSRLCFWLSAQLGGRYVFGRRVCLPARTLRDGRIDYYPGLPDHHLGGCYRCRKSWKWVEPHTTNYAELRGCFPLCEGCWAELPPQGRLVFYDLLVDEWIRQLPEERESYERERELIAAAVRGL